MTATEDDDRSLIADAEILASIAADLLKACSLRSDHLRRSLKANSVRQSPDDAVNKLSGLPVVVDDSRRMAVAKSCFHGIANASVQAGSGDVCDQLGDDVRCLGDKSVQSVVIKSEPQDLQHSVASNDVAVKAEKVTKGLVVVKSEPPVADVPVECVNTCCHKNVNSERFWKLCHFRKG